MNAGRRGISIVFLLALGLRLGWGLSRPVNDAAIDALPDQRDYLSIASNVLHGQGFQFLDRRFDDTVMAFRMPGYPLFLAGCGANVRVARAVQALIDTSTVLAIYLLGGLLARRQGNGGGGIGLLAACVVALNPFLIYFSGLLLSETLFTAMLAWAMVLLIVGGGGLAPTWRATAAWLAGGILLAISVLVRPSAIALPVVLGIAAAFVNRAPRAAYPLAASSAKRPASAMRRWPLPVGSTMLLLVVLSLLPWALRNVQVLGRWIWLDTNAGFTLYDGYNPDATGASDQSFVSREPELQVLGEVQRSEYLSLKATEYARANPRRVMALMAAKLARTWSPMPLSADYGRPLYRIIGLAYALPLDVLVVLALLRADLTKSAKVFLMAPAIYFSVVHALTVGSLRYRMPVEPPMTLMAAALVTTGAGATWRRSDEDRHPSPVH